MLVSESGTRSGLGSFIKAGWAWLCSSAISSGAALLDLREERSNLLSRQVRACRRAGTARRARRVFSRSASDDGDVVPKVRVGLLSPLLSRQGCCAEPYSANDRALADESRRGCVAQGRRRSGPLFARSLARSCLALEQLAAKQRSCSWIVAVIFDTLTSSRSRQPCPGARFSALVRYRSGIPCAPGAGRADRDLSLNQPMIRGQAGLRADHRRPAGLVDLVGGRRLGRGVRPRPRSRSECQSRGSNLPRLARSMRSAPLSEDARHSPNNALSGEAQERRGARRGSKSLERSSKQ